MPWLSSSPPVVAPTRRVPGGRRSRRARLSATWSRSREAKRVTSLGVAPPWSCLTRSSAAATGSDCVVRAVCIFTIAKEDLQGWRAAALEAAARVGFVAAAGALLEGLAPAAHVQVLDGPELLHVGVRVALVAREAGGLAGALGALLRQVAGGALLQGRVEAAARVDEVRAH